MAVSMAASQEELKAARVPVAWRDGCSVCVLLNIGCLHRLTDISIHTFATYSFAQHAPHSERVSQAEHVSTMGM